MLLRKVCICACSNLFKALLTRPEVAAVNKDKHMFVDKRNLIGWAIAFLISLGVAVFTALVDDIQSLWILAVTFILVVLFYILAFVIVATYYSKKIDEKIEMHVGEAKNLRAENNLQKIPFIDNGNICGHHHHLCCADDLLNDDIFSKLREGLLLSDEEKEYYNLMDDEEFDKKESEFFALHSSGSIWVVSNALETEIKTEDEFLQHPDDSLKRSMGIVQTNIINGGNYIQFVALGPQGENDITYVNRRKLYWSAVDGTEEEKSKRLPIIRIDDEFLHTKGRDRVVDPDLEYLVKLTSTVLFVDEDKSRLFVEGFFCFRPDDAVVAKSFEKRTIFYRMPKCMQDDYYFFLKKKKEKRAL